MQRPSLTRYAWLSIAAAMATILLKGLAWRMTDSVGLLSDAIESFVNLAGAIMALWMLTLAAQPADDDHAHGHGKAEYFSSAFEGFLILLAAVSIAYTAIERLNNPQALAEVAVGLLVSAAASAINLSTARVLMKVGRMHHSITLEADAQHLMTDVWTSAGVIAGVGLVWLTGWLWLDPAIALLVAANIVWTGWQLMQRSAAGLMDTSLPAEKLGQIETLLAGYRSQGLDFHALRTRQAGSRVFVSLHVLVPGEWTVQRAHDWAERIEADIREVLPNANVTTHLEPLEDPVSMVDQELDRPSPGAPTLPEEDATIEPIKDSADISPIPSRAETLEVLRLMGKYAPILMLSGDADGYGARWTIDGHPIEPAIAKYLMQSGFVADTGATEFGARKLALTASGAEFRAAGANWWSGLSLLQKIKVMFRG